MQFFGKQCNVKSIRLGLEKAVIELSDIWNGFAFLPLDRKIFLLVFFYFGIAFAAAGLEIFLNNYVGGKRSKHLVPAGVMFGICATAGLSLVFFLLRDLVQKGAAARERVEETVVMSNPERYADPELWAELKTRAIWFAFDSGGPPMTDWLDVVVGTIMLSATLGVFYLLFSRMRAPLRAKAEAISSSPVEDAKFLNDVEWLLGVPPRKEDQ